MDTPYALAIGTAADFARRMHTDANGLGWSSSHECNHSLSAWLSGRLLQSKQHGHQTGSVEPSAAQNVTRV